MTDSEKLIRRIYNEEYTNAQIRAATGAGHFCMFRSIAVAHTVKRLDLTWDRVYEVTDS